ncbi:GGDEF domain-containing protein [Yoonia sp. SS1-5]|uniref:diguanylate cyclase n=1 Tax=Yoonia rhodophyticola TaxID=3137370 RepID=A0AAN0NKN7_9RHOB
MTLISLICAEILNVLLFPPELLRTTMTGTLVIVVVVTMPICLFVGSKMYENAKLGAQLQQLLNRDRLTDVATRDYFFSRMEAEPNAYGVSLMVDIDWFKAVNDRYGHLAGDAVIQAVAAALRKHTRAQDIVCRFGGEEFVVFLFDHTIRDGYDVAERLRLAIEEALISAEGHDISVTVSIGGSLKERVAAISTAIKEADEALYRAKSLGRNRTVFAGIASDRQTLAS